MQYISLPSEESVPALGIGTWRMGESSSTRAEEIATLRLALELGVTLIDTAEMYGDGRAEELVGEAIQGERRSCFLVSKVYPQNASREGTVVACERSLRRLKTDQIDLYLLHWRGEIPLEETMEAFSGLQRAGKIRHYGVSNFDLKDMEELWTLTTGRMVATDQLLYNLSRRGIEFELLPWLRQRNLPVMAYSPVEQGRLLRNAKLVAFARKYEMTPAQAALSWLLSQPGLIVIPKTSSPDRLRENVGALNQRLSSAQMAELEELFPPPQRAQPLEML
jgi:diketogulonate reductase-like aldo/keto reductase